ENFVEKLSAYFPQEREAIRQYVEKMEMVCNQFPLYRLDSEENPESIESIMALKADEVIEGLTDNPKLRAVLAGTNFLYAGIENKTPFYVHALSINSYIESAWRCLGGGSQIAKLLIGEIRKHGGIVLKRKEVTSFHTEEGEVKSVETADGEFYYGKKFISNIDPKMTMDLLENQSIRKSYLNRIKSIENTVSSFS